jgi:hypothetical protein
MLPLLPFQVVVVEVRAFFDVECVWVLVLKMGMMGSYSPVFPNLQQGTLQTEDPAFLSRQLLASSRFGGGMWTDVR